MLDVLIRGGFVLDGSGTPGFPADVGIEGGKVAFISRGIGAHWDAARVLDARGMIVCPGFIDVHTHSDFSLIADPMAVSKVHQGVTTEVVGNCGFWVSPVLGEARDLVRSQMQRYGPLEPDWTGIGGYLERLGRKGIALNVAALVGFGNLRMSVMGSLRREPSESEIREMRGLLERDIDEGAFGMSTGLFYAPQNYASTQEVIEVARGLVPAQALYVTHIRDEGNYNVGLEASLEEAFQTAREASVPLHISHLQANGIAAWHSAPSIIESIEAQQRAGIEITADVYPYDRCGGGISGSVMPRWALEGGRSGVLKRLQDPDIRCEIARQIAQTFKKRGGADLHVFSSFPPNPEFEGKTLEQVAATLGEPPEFAVLTLLEQSEASWVSAILNEDDVRAIMSCRWVMIGSDGSALALSGPVAEGRPHPRNFGTHPRVLGRYANEIGLFPLHEAVRKMTSLPAGRFRIKKRGLLSEGFFADIVVFDGRNVRDTASFSRPHSLPMGIRYVMVNGALVVDEGKHTMRLPGKALARG